MTDPKSLSFYILGFFAFFVLVVSVPLWNKEIIIFKDFLLTASGCAMGGAFIRDQMIKDYKLKPRK